MTGGQQPVVPSGRRLRPGSRAAIRFVARSAWPTRVVAGVVAGVVVLVWAQPRGTTWVRSDGHPAEDQEDADAVEDALAGHVARGAPTAPR